MVITSDQRRTALQTLIVCLEGENVIMYHVRNKKRASWFQTVFTKLSTHWKKCLSQETLSNTLKIFKSLFSNSSQISLCRLLGYLKMHLRKQSVWGRA